MRTTTYIMAAILMGLVIWYAMGKPLLYYGLTTLARSAGSY